mgnify:CR=1 FL=1
MTRKNNAIFYIKVSLIPHWGFMLTQVGATKSRIALRVLPPTTLIGALAYSLFHDKLPEERVVSSAGKRKGLSIVSAADYLRDVLISVNAKINVPFIRYADLSRIFFYDVRRKVLKSDAVAVGKIYTGRGDIRVTYLFDSELAEEKLGTRWKEELAVAAMSIVRVGSKESIVSAIRVEYGEAKPVEAREVETSYYFPSYAATPLRGVFSLVNVVDWTKSSIGSYLEAEYTSIVVPYDSASLRVSTVRAKLSDGVSAYDVGGEIVVPWR